MKNDTSNTLVAATVLEMAMAVVAVIRGGCGGKSSCRKATNAVRAIGKKKMKTADLTKALETEGRTDGRTKPLNEMRGRI